MKTLVAMDDELERKRLLQLVADILRKAGKLQRKARNGQSE